MLNIRRWFVIVATAVTANDIIHKIAKSGPAATAAATATAEVTRQG